MHYKYGAPSGGFTGAFLLFPTAKISCLRLPGFQVGNGGRQRQHTYIPTSDIQNLGVSRSSDTVHALVGT